MRAPSAKLPTRPAAKRPPCRLSASPPPGSRCRFVIAISPAAARSAAPMPIWTLRRGQDATTPAPRPARNEHHGRRQQGGEEDQLGRVHAADPSVPGQPTPQLVRGVEEERSPDGDERPAADVGDEQLVVAREPAREESAGDALLP